MIISYCTIVKVKYYWFFLKFVRARILDTNIGQKEAIRLTAILLTNKIQEFKLTDNNR